MPCLAENNVFSGSVSPEAGIPVRRFLTCCIPFNLWVISVLSLSEVKAFDSVDALNRVGGDIKLFFELIKIFDEDYPETLGAMQKAVASSCSEEIQMAAHSAKSALGNIGAMRAFEFAKELENLALDGKVQNYALCLDELEKAGVLFREEVEVFRKSIKKTS